MSEEKVKSFCDEFNYPFIVLYGLEQAFLGIAEFWNGHKIVCYAFWEEIQKSDEVFKGKEEGFIKFHLPLLITRIKDGINPLLNNIVWEDENSEKMNLKEILEFC